VAYENIIYEKYGTDNRIGRITLNRPEKLNALSPALLEEFEQCLKEAALDQSVRVLVIRGAGRAFGPGYDISGAGAAPAGGRRRARLGEAGALGPGRWGMQDGARRQLFLWNLPKITIAQIHGFCLAGSCEYAMMCDLVIAADDAQIGHPAVRAMGHPRNSCIFPMLIGMRKSKELLYMGNQVSGKEAEQMGMINKSVPVDQLEDEVNNWAERISHQSADALAIHKETLNRWWQNMGIDSSIRSSADYDLMYSLSEQGIAWREKAAELGMKGALEWRDGPYGDLRGRKA